MEDQLCQKDVGNQQLSRYIDLTNWYIFQSSQSDVWMYKVFTAVTSEIRVINRQWAITANLCTGPTPPHPFSCSAGVLNAKGRWCLMPCIQEAGRSARTPLLECHAAPPKAALARNRKMHKIPDTTKRPTNGISNRRFQQRSPPTAPKPRWALASKPLCGKTAPGCCAASPRRAAAAVDASCLSAPPAPIMTLDSVPSLVSLRSRMGLCVSQRDSPSVVHIEVVCNLCAGLMTGRQPVNLHGTINRCE